MFVLGGLRLPCQGAAPMPSQIAPESGGAYPADRTKGRLLIVENDHLLRGLLGTSLCPAGWQPVLAATGAEARAHLRTNAQLDVAVVDLELPDAEGISLVRHLTGVYPSLPVVIITCAEELRIIEAFRAGACGCLCKKDLGSTLAPALDEALAGGAPMSRTVARLLLTQVRGLSSTYAVDAPTPPRPNMTIRERQVIEQLARGFSYDDVARVLDISPNTVRSYIRTIYEKLDVSSKTEAVLMALRLGLVNVG